MYLILIIQPRGLSTPTIHRYVKPITFYHNIRVFHIRVMIKRFKFRSIEDYGIVEWELGDSIEKVCELHHEIVILKKVYVIKDINQFINNVYIKLTKKLFLFILTFCYSLPLLPF